MNICAKTRGLRRGFPVRSIVRITLLVGVGPVICACSRDPVDLPRAVVEPAAVVAVPAALTLRAGGEAYLSAQANDRAGQPIGGAKFSFHAAEPALLRVTEQGLVRSTGAATALTHVIVASGRREQAVAVTVLAGPPQRIEKLSGDAQVTLAGVAVAEPLTARLVDAWNNALGNVPMVARDSAGYFPPIEVTTGPDGTAQFRLPPITRAGAVAVLVGPANATSPVQSFQIEVQAGPPSAITLVPASADAPAVEFAGGAPRVRPDAAR
jgi:hypothetical protein